MQVYLGSNFAFLERKFFWNILFCDPHNEGKPNSATSFEFLRHCNRYFIEDGSLIFFISVSIASPLLGKKTPMKYRLIVFCLTIPIVRKFLKLLSLLICLKVPTLVSAITYLSSPIKYSIEDFTHEEDVSIKLPRTLIFTSEH